MDEQLPVPPRANGSTNGGRAASHPNYRITNVAAGHRANHLTYGHVGRVAYIPAEDDDRVADYHGVGRLSTNRGAEAEAYSFRQVTPCRLWCPPAVPPQQSPQTVSPLADAKPAARSLHWLLREAPNALVGVASASYSPALLRELRASAAAQPPRTRLPLLARGQITSLAGAAPSACAALATAVGESGHILRISRMRHDDWAWPGTGSGGRASRSVPLLRGALVDPAEEGYWCAGPTAINQVKFAAQPASTSSPRPVRWVLAQTAQATHVFAPTLHKVPVPEAGPSACGGTACTCSRFGLSYISPNPLVRISMDQTGGKPHCDVAFNPARTGATTTAADDSNPQPPQVAIVDQGGNWTVWDLLEICRPGRKEKITSLQAVLRARGNVADGVSPRTHWAAAASGLGNLHRILWLAPARPSSGMRSSTLLLGNATSVHVVEISAQESDLDTTEEHTRHHLLHTLNMTRQDWLDVVLDVQLLPTHPWHVAVLTTTTLFWLDLSPHTEKRPGNGHSTPQRSGNFSGHGPSRHPVVLLSFPHLRDPTDKTLKLCVTPACPSGDELEERPSPQTSLVLVYAITRPEVSLFWLTLHPTDAGREASYQHQLFPLTLLPLERSAAGANNAIESLRWTGAQTLSVLPLSFAPQARPGQGFGGDRAAALAPQNVSAPVGTHFFQVLAFGSDQRVCSALYANTPRLASQGPLSVAPPHPAVPAEDLKRKWEKERRRAMRQAYEDSFVVPDDFSENPFSPPSWRRPGGAASRLQTVARGPRATAGLPRVGSRSEQDAAGGNATYVVPGVHALLREGLGRAADAVRTTGGPDDLQAPASLTVNVDSSPLDIIRQVVERGFVQGSSPFTTLLDAANDAFMAVFPANQTAYSWALKLAELGYIEQGRVFLFDQMQGGSARGGHKLSASVLEAMERLCALPAWLEEGEVARQASSAFRGYRQQHTRLLSYAAAQLFLAQISVVVVPKRLQLQRQADQAANFPLSRAAATKRLQPGQVDRFGRLGEPLPAQSSPVAPRHRDMPDWLASSQEFASSQAEGGLGDAEDGGNDDDDDDDDEQAEEDSTIARLRQYAVSIRSEPPFVRDDPVVAGITGSTTIPASGGVTINNIRLLSHWVLGSDPDHFHWVPVAGGSAGAAEEALRLAALEAQEQKRRRREEKRAQRERERMLLMGAAGLGASIASPRFSALHPPPTPGLPPSSPLPPRILASSQFMPSDSQTLPRQIIPGSSQPASSQALPSQVWPSSSQRTAILTGSPFGSGNRPKKKKAKTARGLR